MLERYTLINLMCTCLLTCHVCTESEHPQSSHTHCKPLRQTDKALHRLKEKNLIGDNFWPFL